MLYFEWSGFHPCDPQAQDSIFGVSVGFLLSDGMWYRVSKVSREGGGGGGSGSSGLSAYIFLLNRPIVGPNYSMSWTGHAWNTLRMNCRLR